MIQNDKKDYAPTNLPLLPSESLYNQEMHLVFPRRRRVQGYRCIHRHSHKLSDQPSDLRSQTVEPSKSQVLQGFGD